MAADYPNVETGPSGLARGFSPLHEARHLLGQKRYREAHTLCRNVIEQDPDKADAFYVLGIISYEHHDFERALKLFGVAIEKHHPEPGPHVQSARCLANLNLPKQALEQIEAAIRLDPTDGFTLSSIAATFSRLDRHEDAVAFHQKATEAAPDDALNHFNLGSALQFMGDFEAARAAYRNAVRLVPEFIPARAHLSLITQQTSEQNDLSQLGAAWQKRHPADAEGGLQLAHAIAKVHEDLGDTASAMQWLDRGKALIRQHVPDRSLQDKASFEAAKSLAHTLPQDAETQADGPIFIVGLPRSGTTLVDRILSSHSQVISAGERTEFAACLHAASGLASQDIADARIISQAGGMDLPAIGASYVERVSAILGSKQRFTDKMPINALFVPAILAALPSTRVICLRRHPADSVLGIYRQLFAANALHYRYAHDLENLAHYVVAFHDLVETYSQTLPASRFMVMDYETLVDDPDAQIRRALDFSGLGFEPACLDFQHNAAPVATASVSQVRKAIYTTSKGRWKKYQSELKPALAILRTHGLLAG